MTDLADLFSTTSPPPSPLRPPTDTLFLSPSSSIAPTPQARRNNSSHNRPTSPPPPPLKFDHDLGDLDLDFDLSDLPPPLTEGDVNGSRLIPVDDPLAALDFGRRDGGDEERVGKKRKPVAKIDADRLMGDKGFPALMRAAKRFKPRGKGHEVADLRDLLEVYQLWAHGMFPKGDFAGTIARVENVCRTRRLENAMKGYREAFYPPAKCPTPRPRSPGAEDRDSTPRSGEQDEQERMGIAKEPLFTAAPEGDEGDELEMMALEEMKREDAARRPPLEEDGPPEVEEEDEWEGLYD